MEHNSDLLFDVLRFFARVGFLFLVISIYRLWRVLTSAKMKTGARKFIRLSTVMGVLSFVLLCSDYYFDTPFSRYTSIIFNTAMTYTVAFFIHIKASRIPVLAAPEVLESYHQALDNLIASMKRNASK